MGSSTKKKNDKKQDFKKPKLKVGKARPKNTNATDTSFAARAITLKQTSLATSAPDSIAKFTYHLSLVTSKADSQRRDALSYLANTCANVDGSPLPLPPAVIIPKVQALILDANTGVRQQLLKLFRALPARELGSVEHLLLYTRAGMTHLSNDIRLFALEVLDWLVEVRPDAVVACAGGWVKTLMTFQNLLAWKGAVTTKGNAKPAWSTSKSSSNSLGSSKLVVRQLNTLAAFLQAGLQKPPPDDSAAILASELFPLWQTEQHMMPTQSNPFGYLNLFGAPRDVESEVYSEPEERRAIFNELMSAAFVAGAGPAKREGGEAGRAAALVDKVLKLAQDG